jgi:integrase
MSMGRKRKGGNPLGLEPRVYWHHGQFFYVHGKATPGRAGEWEPLGTDVDKANDKAKVYNDPERRQGTLGHFIDLYIADAEAGRLLKKKASRTIDDYKEQAEYLKAGLGKLTPLQLVTQPSLIADYRDDRTAKVRGNRELSLLSALFTWIIEKGKCAGVTVNPLAEIQRNPESPKDRYVEDAEYKAVYGIAQRSVCMAMELVYHTLQRPARVLAIAPTQIRTKTVGGTATAIIAFEAAKRGHAVDIAITPQLEAALRILTHDDDELGQEKLSASVTRAFPTLVHDLGGEAYTLEGVGGMLRRYCKLAKVPTFGLMDIRAKGATDMYLAGIPLETIQRLMGHKSKTTTEIYIKRLLQTITIAQPNPLRVGT